MKTLVAFLLLVSSAIAQQPHIKVVLYTPSDVQPPTGYQERLTEVVNYAERFYTSWMLDAGYPPANMHPFDRNPDGSALVYRFTSTQNVASKTYLQTPADFGAEVSNTLVPKYDLGRNQHCWWVFVYAGPNAAAYTAEGEGNAAGGGTGVVHYNDISGVINQAAPCVDGVAMGFTLKAAMHELGHAFGLPHDGGLRSSGNGMSMMGVAADPYWSAFGGHEGRVYLTPAGASMLWKHPIFSGTVGPTASAAGFGWRRVRPPDKSRAARASEPRDRSVIPSVAVSGLVLTQQGANIVLSGTLTTNYRPHSAVVCDLAAGQAPGQAVSDYWSKYYTTRLTGMPPTVPFSVTITEPGLQSGTLSIAFCFNNGCVTGDGKTSGMGGAVKLPYTAGTYRLEDQ